MPKHCLYGDIQKHYARSDLADAILDALENAGKDLNRLTPVDLAPIDEFHIRGREATLELARAAKIDAGKHVLDVGSGLGGTTRFLAHQYGCQVTGIDLTEEYCRVAEMLTSRVGLDRYIDYHQGDATNMSFPGASFDIVCSVHTAMNIPDKSRLYSEIFRVLKPGGTLAVYDILAGPSGPVTYPLPWARTAQTSFLVTPEELRKLLEQARFKITAWTDTTDESLAWNESIAEKIHNEGLPPLSFHLLLGPEFRNMAQNQLHNLKEGRIVVAQVIAKK